MRRCSTPVTSLARVLGGGVSSAGHRVVARRGLVGRRVGGGAVGRGHVSCRSRRRRAGRIGRRCVVVVAATGGSDERQRDQRARPLVASVADRWVCTRAVLHVPLCCLPPDRSGRPPAAGRTVGVDPRLVESELTGPSSRPRVALRIVADPGRTAVQTGCRPPLTGTELAIPSVAPGRFSEGWDVTVPLTAGVDQPRRAVGREATPAASFTSVVHVNEKGGRFGGTEEYIALLTAGLGARGVRSHLVCGVSTGRRRPGSARCTSSTGSLRAGRSPARATAVARRDRRHRSRRHLPAQRVRPGRRRGHRPPRRPRGADLVCPRPLRDVPERAAVATRPRQLPPAPRTRLSDRHRRGPLRVRYPDRELDALPISASG